jgi:hypothetical protein
MVGLKYTQSKDALFIVLRLYIKKHNLLKLNQKNQKFND